MIDALVQAGAGIKFRIILGVKLAAVFISFSIGIGKPETKLRDRLKGRAETMVVRVADELRVVGFQPRAGLS